MVEKIMAFPKNLDELKTQGYKFENDAICRGCGEDIEWWTTPTGKNMPGRGKVS